MKNRRNTPEQIVRKLREADRLLGEGQELPEVVKALEVSEATFHRWRAQYAGMKADDAKRLKELERENSRLKLIVADQLLDIEGLKEFGWRPVPRIEASGRSRSASHRHGLPGERAARRLRLGRTSLGPPHLDSRRCVPGRVRG